jgi:hypothetical protein
MMLFQDALVLVQEGKLVLLLAFPHGGMMLFQDDFACSRGKAAR